MPDREGHATLGESVNEIVRQMEVLRTSIVRLEADCARYRRALLDMVPGPNEPWLMLERGTRDAALASYAGAKAQQVLEAAKILDRETVARKMHESWSRTKRAQGFHGPAEGCWACSRGVCGRHHPDLVLWELLPESQKDINRHAFDDVLGSLWKAIAAMEGKDG